MTHGPSGLAQVPAGRACVHDAPEYRRIKNVMNIVTPITPYRAPMKMVAPSCSAFMAAHCTPAHTHTPANITTTCFKAPNAENPHPENTHTYPTHGITGVCSTGGAGASQEDGKTAMRRRCAWISGRFSPQHV